MATDGIVLKLGTQRLPLFLYSNLYALSITAKAGSKIKFIALKTFIIDFETFNGEIQPYEKVKLSNEIWSRNSSSRPTITSIIIINTSWNSKLRKNCNFYENFGVCMLIRIN